MVEIDLGLMGSPHLEKKFISGDCTFRSPLPKLSKSYKNHRRDEGGNKLLKVNNNGEKYAQ
jgi:hypothetical protein